MNTSDIVNFPAQSQWIETPTGRRILGALSFTQATGDVALIYGAAAVGKTRAAIEYAACGVNVWRATITQATTGVVPALGEICAAIGIAGCNGAASLHSAIVSRISGTEGLLIVDEAHQLSTAALDQLRSIYDASGVGLALIGSLGLYSRLTAGEDATCLDRLLSRVGKRLHLDTVTPEDIGALADAWGIRNCKRSVTLQEIAQRPGGLRLLSKTVRLARLACGSRTMTDGDIRNAWRELGG